MLTNGYGNALPAIITADAADDLGPKERDTCIPFITALNTFPEKNGYAMVDSTVMHFLA